MLYLNNEGTTEVSVKFTTKTQDDQIEVRVLSYNAKGEYVPWVVRGVDERIIIDETTEGSIKFSLGEDRERGFAAIVLTNNYDEMAYIHIYVVQRLVHSKKFTFKASEFQNNNDGSFSFKLVSKNATKKCGWIQNDGVLHYDLTEEGDDIINARLMDTPATPFQSVLVLTQERSGNQIVINTLNSADNDGNPVTQVNYF